MKKLILASASPRRQDLLKQIGLSFDVMVSNVAEDTENGLTPGELVEKLAWQKAELVAGQATDSLVIGADTIVVSNGRIMGKPVNNEEAAEMLSELSGTTHEVITGVALIDTGTGRQKVFHETTRVSFRSLTVTEIKAYIDSGETQDKAGAYAIQGLGAVLVEGIAGCYFNVVGLPLFRLAEELQSFGVQIFRY